ncbi:CBS domain-containing protein [Streptomyces flavotricini]|nr:CBS domain-containing protein [Streptomyces flavotricini]
MKHIKVGDLMTDEVLSVVTSTSFKDAAKLLAQHDISGLPVLVDDEDRLVGIVTRRDLLMLLLRPDGQMRRRVVEEIRTGTMGPGVVGGVPRLTARVDDSPLTAPPRSSLLGMPW